jgi:predicted membrane-bound spermidine synthase
MTATRLYLGIFLISLSVLMLELTLTRIFSVVMYYHFAFMAISLALFGSGVSGLYVYLFPKKFSAARVSGQLALSALAFALAMLAALFVVANQPIGLSFSKGNLLRLGWIYVAASVPFFFAGLCLSLALTHYTQHISNVYFSDLAGASAGCLLVLPFLNWFGGPVTVFLISMMAMSAALTFSNGDRTGSKGTAKAAIGLMILCAITLALNARHPFLQLTYAKGEKEKDVLFSKWNSISRITVHGSPAADALELVIDGGASTRIYRSSGNGLSAFEDFKQSITALAYQIKTEPDVLIIGPGGGVDVITARLFNSRHILAAEINPIIVNDVMKRQFANYSGHLYTTPGVDVVVSEGRSFLQRAATSFDIIQLTLVDTWAATAAGAFSLSENSLYTTEAFIDYVNHLKEDGVLTVARWLFQPPQQTLRLAALAIEALQRLGVSAPQDHIIIVGGENLPGSKYSISNFLLKKSKFRPEEIQYIESKCAELGFQVIYSPSTHPDNPFTQLIAASDKSAFYRAYSYDITPTTDDRPFFFYSIKPGQFSKILRNVIDKSPWGENDELFQNNFGALALAGVCLISIVLVATFILAPLITFRLGSLRAQRLVKMGYIFYFACLGLGFIALEIALLQKVTLFLGHPSYALTVVLFSLLLSSGLGSFSTGRVAAQRLKRRLYVALLGTAAVTLVYLISMHPIFHHLIGYDLAFKMTVSVLMLTVLGFLAGMPFPIGIKLLSRRFGELIPWAWGVNGAASVLGSILATIVAINFGFNALLLAGIGTYLCALALAARAE